MDYDVKTVSSRHCVSKLVPPAPYLQASDACRFILILGCLLVGVFVKIKRDCYSGFSSFFFLNLHKLTKAVLLQFSKIQNLNVPFGSAGYIPQLLTLYLKYIVFC